MRLINPNFHVILIHYPLGLLGLGLLIEIFSFLWPRGTFRIAGRWMLLLGALGTVPAATSGIFAKYDIMSGLAGTQGKWIDIKHQAGLTGLQWEFLNQHVLFNSIASALAVLTVIVWLGGTNRWRRFFHIPALILLLAAQGLMVAGAWNGGEMIYRTQFATIPQSQAQADDQLTQAKLAASKTEKEHTADLLDYYSDPLQVHVIFAGLLFAMAAAALGMTLRRAAVLHQASVAMAVDEPVAVAPAAPATVPARPASPMISTAETLGDTGAGGEMAVVPLDPPNIAPATIPYPPSSAVPVQPVDTVWHVPAARFWVIAVVLGLMTAAGGWYTITYDDTDAHFFDFGGVFRTQIEPSHRMLAHLIIGVTIIVLSLVMLGASRARSRAMIWMLGLITMAAVAAQITVGVLMMYDTDDGPLYQFNETSPSTFKQAMSNDAQAAKEDMASAMNGIADKSKQMKDEASNMMQKSTLPATTQP